mmetsp:Transcript_754/g.1342  ORF Transcript_754/g.1342 Transcript_754/m.1342 type:complete len:377 (-) Transcript_754:77-1207(-)
MEVVLGLCGEIVVDDERHLLHVDTTGEKVRGDEHAGGAGAELAHDDVTGVLVHVSVGGGHGVVASPHLVGQPVDLTPGVSEDNALCDGQRLVEIAQGVQLPLLALHVHVELLDTLEGQLVTLHENAHRLAHELAGDLKSLWGHSGREHAHLQLGGEQLEDVVDLVLEPAGKHLISLVEDEALDVVGAQCPTAEHVVHATGGSDHDVHAALESALILTHAGSTDARVALHLKVVAQGAHNLLDLLRQLTGGGEHERLSLHHGVIERVQDAAAEGRGLTGTGLRLLDHIETLGEGHDTPLLDGGGLLETVSVDATQQVLVEAHGVEGLVNLVPLGGKLLRVGVQELGHLAVVLTRVEGIARFSGQTSHDCVTESLKGS